jgi:DNA-binding NarL/FixJ family response regulator
LLIVDDHDLARAGLRALLSGETDLEIVGEADSGQAAVERSMELRPDVVLMDVRMPDLDGLAATAIIKERCPDASVIIFTLYENADYLFQAIRAGAAGYLLKDATREEIVQAVRDVLAGESILTPALATQVLRRLTRDTPRRAPGAVEKLTDREVDVLNLLVQGQTNREIAYNLSVSVGTIKVHVEHIIAKLGVSDRTQAAVRAVQLGLVPALGD